MRDIQRILVILLILLIGVDLSAAMRNGAAAGQEPKPQAGQTRPEEPQAVTERSRVEKIVESQAINTEQFGNFRFPIINNKGDVAVLAMFPVADKVRRFGQAIFIRRADGSWEVVSEGQKAVNMPEPVHSFNMPSFNNNGELTFMAAFGSAVEKSATQLDPNDPINNSPVIRNQALFIKGADGIRKLIKFGEEVPNMPSYFSGVSNPSTNDKGTTAFIGTYTDPDGRGLFLIEGGKLRLVARSGQKISRDNDSTFSEHYYPTPVNERNEVAFLARVGDKSGVFVARPGGIEKIAFIGDPSPIKGANYLGFGNRTPTLNHKGEVAFSAFYDGPDAGRGLFFKGLTGPVQIVAKSGDTIPNTTYNFTDFNSPAINARGDIAFIGNFGGRNRGIFMKTAKGIIPVALADQRIPGGTKDDVFNNFTPPSINDRGEVVFYAQWRTSSGVDIGIFHLDEKGVLNVLVKRGDKMPKQK